MLEEERSVAEASGIASWSEEERAEAARNFRELIAILREWDNGERMDRVRRVLKSASSKE